MKKKKRFGRPKRKNGRRRTIYFDQKLYSQLRYLSFMTNKSISSFLEEATKEYCKARAASFDLYHLFEQVHGER